MTLRHADIPAMHPGELLREDVLPALGKSKAEIARLLGVSRPTLYAILDEARPVSPDMAARLGKLCGNGAGIWLRLQADYDLENVAAKIDVSAIPTLAETAPIS
jgi:addiction module HigA family antidote